ncbi:MAG TPA: Uma2 family endonuclease [Isosphaeraceae bacterium]|jgi:Uma2 family endonuclease
MATDVALSPIEAEPRAVEPDGLYEVVDGRVVEKVMGAYESQAARLLVAQLLAFLQQNPLGVVEFELLFLIDRSRDLKRRPDVAFVSRERWPLERRAPRRDAWDVVPDLMIEVVSPSNSASEVVEKIEDYFRAGARLVWIVYPVQGVVHVFETPETAHVLRRNDALDGGDVLPGFRLPLATLFEGEPEVTPG